jgi:hypothetical protein
VKSCFDYLFWRITYPKGIQGVCFWTSNQRHSDGGFSVLNPGPFNEVFSDLTFNFDKKMTIGDITSHLVQIHRFCSSKKFIFFFCSSVGFNHLSSATILYSVFKKTAIALFLIQIFWTAFKSLNSIFQFLY